ncbi:ornithine cyclodeaminase [Photobacterium proteolyticum]|uniref:Ornithine cyclodeaminase n=1 Tax=Photobacterium proteolyticum TaxID=1903952 RepID=A0A1Q9GLX6_9GAMM|nr:ornithine cyclodeaminase family protein [Photobacterium proteolyticum]OLQ75544.1 ornithine cyclodeaminase [Photobacterium proteolyticum]
MQSHPTEIANNIAKPLILCDAEVRDLLPQLDVQELMKSLFLALSDNTAVQPPQTLALLPNNAGDFITYLGAMAKEAVFGAKLSPYLITEQQPIITAWTSLMSMQTGQPLLWCDSSQLTVERTAGTTALAIDYLAPENSSHLALIGAGTVGLTHLRHVLKLRRWQTISLYAPELLDNPARRDEIMSIDPRIQIAIDASHCTKEADVIMLCTSSAQPVISLTDIKPSAVITSISTNAANAHEVPPALLNQADVYCDYQQTTPDSAGEMCLAASQHGWDKSQIKGDLASLVAQTCPLPDYDKPVFFRSIGLGLEDVAMAYGIWKLASQQLQ